MYGACVRFYNTLLTYSELEEMKEDLIERITTMLFYNDGLTDLVVNLCQFATTEDEGTFKERLGESVTLDMSPTNLAVSKYFTMQSSTKIDAWYLKQLKRDNEKLNEHII